MNDFLVTLSPLLKRATRIVLTITMALAALVVVLQMVIVAFFPYSIDYGEGPLLDQAVRIHEGEPVYTVDIHEPPYVITNYPPVFIGLMSLFNSRESSSLLPGRIISMMSTLGAAVFIYLIVYENNKDKLAGFLAATLYLIFPFAFQWGGFMRVDNLALLFATAALYVLLRWREKKWVLIPIAILLTLAAYTRQSYLLAAPFACGVYLLFKDWKRAFYLAVITVLLVGVLFGIFMVSTDGGFWQHIGVANQNTFNWDTVEHYFKDQLWDEYQILSLMTILFFLTGWRRIDEWKLVGPFLLGAIGSAITVGKIGSSVNYLLELCAAMALSAGLYFSFLRKEEVLQPKWLSNKVVQAIAIIVFGTAAFFQMRAMLEIDLLEKADHIKYRRSGWEELEEINAIIGSVPGRVLLTEQMNLVPQNGKTLYLQPFEMTQLYYDGTWNQRNFLKEIDDKEFDLILFHEWDGERWTEEMRETVWDNYFATDYLANTTIYRPVAEDEVPASRLLYCHPESDWITPTSGEFGAIWFTRQAFIAGGQDWGTNPVYAVADGLLYRFWGWSGAVAIQHDDPFNPGEKVWTFYGSMRNAWNENEQYIIEKFPLGAQAVPVKQGQLLGYQGVVDFGEGGYQARLHFAVVPADEDGNFPTEWMELPVNPVSYMPELKREDPLAIKDTAQYLGIVGSTSSGYEPYWYPYRCDVEGGE